MGEFTRQFLKRNETLPLPASSRRSFEAMEGRKQGFGQANLCAPHELLTESLGG